MASLSFPTNNHRFQIGDTTLQGDKAKAYANAMKVKAEVEAARDTGSPTEVFIQQSQDMSKMPVEGAFDAKKSFFIYSKGENGEVNGFFQHDDRRGVQYKVASGVAASMIGGGGLAGAMFGIKGEMYQSVQRNEDGSSLTQTVMVDKKSGLMDYSEWKMPGIHGGT